MNKKIVLGLFLFSVVVFILFLLFQDTADTVRLSESVRGWFENIGIQSDFHSFRSNAHLVVYFFFGLVLTVFGREMGWKWWLILVVGFSFAVLEEGIKVWLPTREFDFYDLTKDWIGLSLAVLLVRIISLRYKNR